MAATAKQTKNTTIIDTVIENLRMKKYSETLTYLQ